MKIQKCRKKSHHFLKLLPWPLTYDLEKLIRSGHYHYQCVYQIWEQSISWFLSYRVNTIAGGGRLRRKTITSPDPSDMGDIIKTTSSKLKGHPRGTYKKTVPEKHWNIPGTVSQSQCTPPHCKQTIFGIKKWKWNSRLITTQINRNLSSDKVYLSVVQIWRF